MSRVRLVTRLDSIRRLAAEREEENLAFRAFLKSESGWRRKKLDQVVHEIARHVSAEIDCTTCANCCRTMAPGITPQDVRRLARCLGLTGDEFEERYALVIAERGKLMVSTPCPFLLGTVCSVYEDRPQCCREFPHLLKPGFLSRSLSVLGNAPRCPIVFNTLERLKLHLGFG